METNYHFQLVLVKLELKRPPLSETLFRVTLLETSKELNPGSNAFQTEEMKIKRAQKIVDLQAMKSFKFIGNKQSSSSTFVIKYELKSASIGRVESISVNLPRMINEAQSKQKTIFQEFHEGQSEQVYYKIYVSKAEPEMIRLLVEKATQQENKQVQVKRSNSISRTKRPPGLNLSRKNGTPASSQTKSIKQPQIIIGIINQISVQSNNPLNNDMSYLKMEGCQSCEQKQSVVEGVKKKIESLPMSEIQKINQLIKNHHHEEESNSGHSQHKIISFKLKVVISLLCIGIFFLIYDTLSDRNMRKKNKHAAAQNKQHHKAEHSSKKDKPQKTSKQTKKHQH